MLNKENSFVAKLLTQSKNKLVQKEKRQANFGIQ